MANYKTPNGKIVEESILRKKYGSRFDELVSNGTFTLEEEEVVKKKDLDFPVQEEVSESITETQTTPTSSESSERVIEVELEDPKKSFDSEVFREMTPEEKISTGTDDYNYLEEIKNSAVGGWYAGSSVDEAFDVYKEGKDISSEDLQEYIKAADKISSIPPSRDMQEFTKISDEAGGGVWGFIKGISQTGSAVIPQVIAQSMTTMGKSLFDSEEVAGTALLSAGAGALSGAAIGSTGFSLGPLGVLTTAGGAIAGTISGFIGGLTGTMETGLVLTEFLKEELGDKEFNEENIRDILEDEELFNKMKQDAVRRGVTIGAVEAATAGLSRGIATNLAKKGLDAPKIAARITPLEMAGGGLGETGGRLAAGQELSATEIGLETIAESKGLINVSDVLSKAQKQQPTYTINGGRASKQNVIDLINSLNKENLKETVAKINIKNDPETSTLLQDKLDDISLETQIPDNITNPETRTKLVELEKERKSLENKTTQSAKNRVIEIDNQIKNLQQDAIQEQETGDILDAEPAESLQEVEEEVREPSIETEEEAVIKDSQIPTSKEIYTIETEEGEGVRTVEITINKDGSRSVVQKVDGDVASSDNIPAANTLNNNEYVEGSFGPIVGEVEVLPMEKVMNPKMKEKLTTKQKQELGLEIEITTEETPTTEVVEEEVVQEVVDDKAKGETKPVEADIVLPTGNKFKDGITRFKKTFLTARRFLPKAWYDIIQNKTAQVQGDVDEFSNLNRDYNKAINKIKDKNERQATEEAAQKLLVGEEVEINEEFRDIITQMREMIDSFSRKLLNDPTISKENKEIIKSNLGTYLTRAYKIYDNNNWRAQVEMGLQDDILNSAKDYLRGQIKRENPGYSEAQVEKDVELAVQEILRGKEGSKWLFGTEVQGKNLKILTQKKQIPLQIRMLMGEYTDVAQTFAKTIINLSSLTNTSQMLRDLTAVGLQTGILKTKDQRTPEFNYQIKGDGSKAFEEIAGLYTTKEIADQFNEMTEQKPVPPGLALWYRIVSLNKYGKTILSPQTHAVNFFSNVGFAFVNGYGNVQELSKAYEAFRNLTRGKKFNKELYNKYIRLGLIDKSVGLSEARELFSDETFESAVLRNIDKKGNNVLSKITSSLKKGFKKFAENPYQAEDDFWKIYAFENEKIRYSNSLYNKKPSELTESELSEVEKIAAENVKKVLPSYDQIPAGIKKLRSIPIVGSFVSFQYESYRTALNTIKLGMSELKDPKLRSAGAKRVGGSITYVAARNALLGYFGKAAGIGIAGIVGSLKAEDDEKEKKRLMKRYLFEWQKESDILPLDIKDGRFSFIDISGSDPHGAINKTINGMTDAKSLGDAAIIGFTESAIKPFLGGEMTAILLAEVLSNKKSKGGQIYDNGDPDDVKYEKRVKYIMKQVSPSAWRQYNKIIESDEKLSTAGQMAVGLKKYNLDINKQFGFKASSFKYDGPSKTKSAYKKAYNKAIEKNASQEELNELYEKYKKEYDERYNEFYLDYISARDIFGVEPKKLVNTMTNRGVSKTKIREIVYGNLPTLPKDPNKKATKRKSRVTGF